LEASGESGGGTLRVKKPTERSFCPIIPRSSGNSHQHTALMAKFGKVNVRKGESIPQPVVLKAPHEKTALEDAEASSRAADTFLNQIWRSGVRRWLPDGQPADYHVAAPPRLGLQ